MSYEGVDTACTRFVVQWVTNATRQGQLHIWSHGFRSSTTFCAAFRTLGNGDSVATGRPRRAQRCSSLVSTAQELKISHAGTSRPSYRWTDCWESIHVHAEIANDGHWLDNAVVDTDRDRNLNNRRHYSKKCTRNWAENKVNSKAHTVFCSLHLDYPVVNKNPVSSTH